MMVVVVVIYGHNSGIFLVLVLDHVLLGVQLVLGNFGTGDVFLFFPFGAAVLEPDLYLWRKEKRT